MDKLEKWKDKLVIENTEDIGIDEYHRIKSKRQEIRKKEAKVELLNNRKEVLQDARWIYVYLPIVSLTGGVVICFFLYFLQGFGVVNLSSSALSYLGLITIAEMAGLTTIAASFVFDTR